jgi:hypothetical protein
MTTTTTRYASVSGRPDSTDYASIEPCFVVEQARNLPFGKDPQRLPRFLEFDRKVLLYHAWWTEPVPESPLESERVHKCDIYYYLEDGSIQVIEHKQVNSGLPQGDIIKRLRIPKSDNSGFYSDKDFTIGAEVRRQ